METTRRRRAGHGKAPRRVIWALLEDLLLVQLGLVVGRVALVEVGHFFLRCLGGGVAASLAWVRVPRLANRKPRSELLAAPATLLARDGAHACSHGSRAFVLVLEERLSCVRDQYSQQSAAPRCVFGLLVSL